MGIEGVPRIFSLGPRPKGRKSTPKAEIGGGVQQAAPHQLGDLWEHCELPQRGSGRNRHRPKGFPLFSALRMASPDTIMLLIVDYHAAIGGWGHDPRAPLRTPLGWDTSLAETIRIWCWCG